MIKLNQNSKVKIIKRYQNRKLYDTEGSSYITFSDITKMVNADEDFQVMDNFTKMDITAATLMQIIFENERKINQYPPIEILRNMIQNHNGSLSQFLLKLGAFADKDLIESKKLAPLILETPNELKELEKNNLKDEYFRLIISGLGEKEKEVSISNQEDTSNIIPENILPCGSRNEEFKSNSY